MQPASVSVAALPTGADALPALDCTGELVAPPLPAGAVPALVPPSAHVPAAAEPPLVSAPARPSNARATMSISVLVENAASTETAANATAPIMSRRRRPIRSPSVPIVIKEPATRKP